MITIIEQKPCKSIFDYISEMAMINLKVVKLKQWLNNNQNWHLLEYHLQEEFPNGTDIDEYADYVVNNADKIFEKIS